MRRQQQTGPMRIVGMRRSVRNVLRQPSRSRLQQPRQSPQQPKLVAEPEAQADEVAALGSLERMDFEEWLFCKELPLDDASLEEWRMSDHYERTMRRRR